jgi:PHP family Zn ribbon phosphoesterase
MPVRCAADLHIHTLLSPCAEVEMIPPLIVRKAVEVGLDMIAISDHNSAENVRAVIEAAESSPLKVLPGMECESVEGVHILCLFDRPEDAESMQEVVYAALPELTNPASKFGEQLVVTADAQFVRYNERLLLAPTALTIEEIVAAVEARSGIAIPAHVDRTGYGLFGVLGFLPETPKFPAVELSRRLKPDDARKKYPDLETLPLICSSDAHMLDDIGMCRTIFYLEHRSVAEIGMAFEKRDGRKVMSDES